MILPSWDKKKVVSVALCETTTVQCLINVLFQDKTAHFSVVFYCGQSEAHLCKGAVQLIIKNCTLNSYICGTSFLNVPICIHVTLHPHKDCFALEPAEIFYKRVQPHHLIYVMFKLHFKSCFKQYKMLSKR